jgi:hypothetical protein
MSSLPFLVGFAVAAAVAGFAALTRFDRDRSFYPTVLIVSASYYLLFAALGGDGAVLIREALGLLLFVIAAVAASRLSRWIVVIGLCGHALFDMVHGAMIANPGTPIWWPAFCLSFDLALAACVALGLRTPIGPRLLPVPRTDGPPTGEPGAIAG